jgi:hypothetical protein
MKWSVVVDVTSLKSSVDYETKMTTKQIYVGGQFRLVLWCGGKIVCTASSRRCIYMIIVHRSACRKDVSMAKATQALQ